MSFTYDPSTTVGRVRMAIGDTVDVGQYSLSDEEIAVINGEEPDPDSAAFLACQTLLAKLAKYSDTNAAGGITIQISQKFAQTKELLEVLRTRATKSAGPYLGGTSISRKTAIDSDTDYQRPSFEVGMDDIQGATADVGEPET